ISKEEGAASGTSLRSLPPTTYHLPPTTYHLLQSPPAAAFPLQESVGGLGAPGAGGVIGEIGCRLLLPGVQDRHHDAPGLFDLIASREERLVAVRHVEQEPLVSPLDRGAELRVREVHVDRLDLEHGSRDLRIEF